MTPEALINKYWDFEKHTWNWPSDDGFKDGIFQVSDRIPQGEMLDRVGMVSDKTGDFMGTVGDIYPERSLAPGSSGDYNIFEGTGKNIPPGWEVRYGEVGEAFDLPGGGTQWIVVDEYGDHVVIDQLLDKGYLRTISGPLHEARLKRPYNGEGG